MKNRKYGYLVSAWIWFREKMYKYADNLASILGVMVVLCFGGLAFGLGAQSIEYFIGLNWQFREFTLTALVSLALGVICALLMIHLARKSHVSQYLENDERVRYVVTEWSIKTLAAQGVGNDVIDLLKDMHRKRNGRDLQMKSPSSPAYNWFVKLQQQLGETRIEEFRDTILRYTRRKTEGQP